MDLSIIVATYNAEDDIQFCLDSILALGLTDFEILIIDSLSSDQTIRICEAHELPVKIFTEKDDGIYDAFNKGVSYSSGIFCYFLGADDRLRIDFSLFLNLAKKKPNIVHYANVTFFPSGVTYGGEFSSAKIAINNISHQSILYPRKLLNNHKYVVKYRVYADYALNISLWKLGFNYINLNVADFNTEGVSSQGDDEFEMDKVSLINQHLGVCYGFFSYLVSKAIRAKTVILSFVRIEWT